MSGDFTSGNRLFVTNDASFGGKLFVGGDASFGGDVSVTSGVLTAGAGLSVTGVVSLPANAIANAALQTSVVKTTGAQTFTGVKTFTTAPIISSIVNTGTLTLPTATGTLSTLDGTETLTNKTITTSGLLTADAGLSVTGAVTLPATSISDSALSGNVVTLTATQALSNKTITSPIIASIVNTGTLTLPTATGTLATLAGIETLTNKTITTSGLLTAGAGLSVTGDATSTRLLVSNDASFNGNVYMDDNLTIRGNLSVQQYRTNLMVYTVSYGFIVAEDMSLNGRLYLSDDLSANKRMFVGGDASFGGKLFVASDLSVNGNLSFKPASIADSALSSNIVTLTGSQSLANKTITAPIISRNISCELSIGRTSATTNATNNCSRRNTICRIISI